MYFTCCAIIGIASFRDYNRVDGDQSDVPEAELDVIIMYDWELDRVVDHVMIITDFSGQYPLVSGHTLPAENR